MIRNQRPTRGAFTLVELMVAMALSIGIMWILAESFKMGLDFTSKMRSTGSQSALLSGAGMVLTRDLQAEHFARDDSRHNGGVKLSDQWMHQLPGGTWTPPKGGFFRIVSTATQPATVSRPLWNDTDGFQIGTAVNHALHFTSVLPASDPNLYTATVTTASGTFTANRAAEVAYFLVDSGLKTSPNGEVLYYLVRRQRLVAPSTDEQPGLNAIASDPGVVAGNGSNTAYTLADMTNPTNRLTVAPVPTGPGLPAPSTMMLGGTRFGEDILLSHVLSFEVLVDWDRNPSVAGSNNAVPPSVSSEWPFGNLSLNRGQNLQDLGVFDTWHSVNGWNNFGAAPPILPTAGPAKLPLAVRVKQLQVTIRIFDPKTKQTRQNTWKFGM